MTVFPEDTMVSIGMPVYNGGADFPVALESLLNQTHRNLEIIISDNGSTDSTEKVCREAAARDGRIVYYRFPQNVGSMLNFMKVLELARGQFFMFACHDDQWAPEFVAANLRNLLAHPDYVASMSAVRYVDGQREVLMPFIERADTRPLLGSVQARVRHYVANSGMNSRFFALFRRHALLNCLKGDLFIAADNAIVVRTLAYGKYGEVPRPLFFRGMTGESSNLLNMLTADRSFPGRFLPLWKYSVAVWNMPHVKREFGLLISLITVNAVFFGMLVVALVRHFVGQLVPRRQKMRI